MAETKNNCEYCGNNPVPHFLTWYQESLNVALAPVRRMLFYNPLAELVGTGLGRIEWSQLLVNLFHRLGIISFQEDIEKCKVRRAQVLWEDAARRGIEMAELRLFGKSFDTYVAKKNGHVLVFSGLPRPASTNYKTLDTIDDKLIFKRTLMAAGLPVAKGTCTRSWHTAVEVFRNLEKPVIVKPRSGSRGRHSTTYIYTEDELKKAFRVAKQLCSWVVVEEHIVGPIYRATVIGGDLCGVLRGDTPKVMGDGHHTIEELVKEKNTLPHPGIKDIALDSKAKIFLARQQMDFSSVPAQGQTVTLSEKIGVNYGGNAVEEIDICHPENKELFVRAAGVVGDAILGFDFIIPDITKSYRQQRCGFIEANSLPFINLHHDPASGPPQNVASHIWDLIGW